MASTTEPTTVKEDESMLPAEDEDTIGEENEEVLLDLKAMNLYKLDMKTPKWIEKESGAVAVKLLKNNETKKVRLVLRHNETLKLCASYDVHLKMLVKEYTFNNKCCVWHTGNFENGRPKDETFRFRFASVEDCKSYRDKIQEIQESMREDSEQRKQGDTAAALVEQLSVEGDGK